MPRFLLIGLAIVLCLSCNRSEHDTSNVSVGSQPSLEFQSTAGQTIKLDSYRGKIVLIDFWATWCGPCMAELPNMLATEKTYGPRGLQILGISLDRDANALARVVRDKNIPWPQHLDENGDVSRRFGVDSIPRCFLIGTDGAVLWTGHPSDLQTQLTKAFAQHPPG